MSTSIAAVEKRHASLKLSNTAEGQVLTASVPSDITDEDFHVVGTRALGLIKKLTGCNCLSGRISFVVEDNFAQVIQVDLGQARG
ncbi:MAG TPA: hypothetical protein VFC63_09175 [Blastocatellia bacterium]|nr:hypothetical protein [Blastocatellia bacterium]